MFWFLLIALVVVVAAVSLAVLGGSGDGVLPEAPPQYLADPLPADRPLGRADVETLRLPTAVRGYRMAEVDDVLSRLGAELAERDARIAELERSLTGTPSPVLFDKGYATGATAVVAEPSSEPEPPADAAWPAPEERGPSWSSPEAPGTVRPDGSDVDDDFDPWNPPPETDGRGGLPEGPKQ